MEHLFCKKCYLCKKIVQIPISYKTECCNSIFQNVFCYICLINNLNYHDKCKLCFKKILLTKSTKFYHLFDEHFILNKYSTIKCQKNCDEIFKTTHDYMNHILYICR